MSNQRAGKFKPATMRAADGMVQVAFFKNAASVLETAGYEDASFYFAQVEDHLREGGSISDSPNDIKLILGL